MRCREYQPDFQLPISHLFGFVKTNLGLGCITERVTDSDGANVPTLAKLGTSVGISQRELDGLNLFIKRLYEVGVCVSDINPANLVYGYRHIGDAGSVTGPNWC